MIKQEKSNHRTALMRLLSGSIICAGLGMANLAYADIPQIEHIDDVEIATGDTFKLKPNISNSAKTGKVNWSLAYGPDDAVVDPLTGFVSWKTDSEMPSESFYIGLRASNIEGSTIEPFIVHVGVTKVVYIGPNENVKNFSDAFSDWKLPGKELRDPGITFVVRDGDYQGSKWVVGLSPEGAIQNIPAGDENHYSTLMAQNPGKVKLSGGAGLGAKGGFGIVKYWAIKGFFMDGGNIGADGADCNGNEECKPHHIKFIMNGINMHHNGSSFAAGHSNYILFENNYAYGGHRIKFLVYKTSNSIFRRNVGRFDHNQQHTGPKNTFSVYTSTNVLTQNNIAIDSDTKEFAARGELAGEYACPTTAGDSSGKWERNIQLNSDFPNANYDLQNGQCYANVEDIVSWDTRGPFLIMTRSPSWFNHVTFGALHPADDPLVLINGWPGRFARGITNSMIHDVSKGPLFEGLVTGSTPGQNGESLERFGIRHVNLTNVNGALKLDSTDIDQSTMTAVNPMWSKENPTGGMRYLVRVEPNSNLSGKGKDGGDLGATIMTFKGKSGTMWGEEGYDSETNVKTWPFPYQEVIAEKMRSMEYTGPKWEGSWNNYTAAGTGTLSGNRGFAKADTNLTDYIWGYLGSTVPPMNVHASGLDESAIVMWDPPAARADITGYKVYDYNPETKKISNPRNVGNQNYFTVPNLSNEQTYHFAVTAISASKPESSYSYPVEVVPSQHPKPGAPTLKKGGTI